MINNLFFNIVKLTKLKKKTTKIYRNPEITKCLSVYLMLNLFNKSEQICNTIICCLTIEMI